MKLYYSPGACSLSPHIVLHESGLPFEAILAPTKTKKLPDGSDYTAVNPLGYVPFLTLDDGRAPCTKARPSCNTSQTRAPARRWLPPTEPGALQAAGMVDVHRYRIAKGFSPLFAPGMPEGPKPWRVSALNSRLAWVDSELVGKRFLMVTPSLWPTPTCLR